MSDKTNEATLIGDRGRLREVILRWMSLVGTSGFLEETGRILERGAPVAMAPLTEAQWTYYTTVNALRSALGIEQAERSEPTVEIIRLAAATITEQAKTLGKINKRLDEVEVTIESNNKEYELARAELREHADKAKTHDPVRKSLLSELHEVLIEQVPDIALSMSADEVVKLATKTVESLAKQRYEDQTLTKGNVNALRKALRRFTKRSDADLDTLNANGIADGLLVILNDPTDTCEVAAASVELLRAALLAHAKDTNQHDTATGFVRQAADVITKQVMQREQVASIIEANAAPLVVTDKLTGHPIGCEAHFAGIRFHCHKTHKRYYEDRRQTFVTFEVYATTQLDREAINALLAHAEAGTVAPLHAPTGCGTKGYGRISAWPNSIGQKSEVTFQFELHATKADAEEAILRLFGHQGHVDSKAIAEGNVEMLRGETVPRADGLYSALINMMSLLWKARFHEEPATEDASPAAEFVNEHQATLEKLADAFADPLDDFLIVPLGAKDGAVAAENATTPDDAEIMAATLKIIDGGTLISTYKGGPPAGGPRTEAALKKLADFGTIERWEDGNHICYGSRATRAKFGPNAGAYTKPHASPFEGKPFDDTDPRNQVHALIEEHGSYGRPFGKSLSFNRDGLLVNDQPHAMNEPIKLVVALLELEQAAPTDLKGYGFTDAAMLVPAASNATREHAAICLAYAGLLHDLRQALQRSLSGLATSAKYNAEQSSDMLAYWTAELARMPIPAAPATKPTPAS